MIHQPFHSSSPWNTFRIGSRYLVALPFKSPESTFFSLNSFCNFSNDESSDGPPNLASRTRLQGARPRLRRCVGRLGLVRAPHFPRATNIINSPNGRQHSVLLDVSFLAKPGSSFLLDDAERIENVDFGVGMGRRHFIGCEPGDHGVH